MKTFLFWFNICMVIFYLTTGSLLFFYNALPTLDESTRKLIAVIIFCYGVYRLIATINKIKNQNV